MINDQTIEGTYTVPMLDADPLAPEYGSEPVALTEEDKQYLYTREQTIEKGRQTFLEVSQALQEIRDYQGGLLYKQEYGTFKDYCNKKLRLSAQHIYRQMAAAEIAKAVSPRGDAAKKALEQATEKQLRVLGKLKDAEARHQVFHAALDANGGTLPSARVLEKMVEAHLNGTSPQHDVGTAKSPEATGSGSSAAADSSGAGAVLKKAPTESAKPHAKTVQRKREGGVAVVYDETKADPIRRDSEGTDPLISETQLDQALKELEADENYPKRLNRIVREFVEEFAGKINELAGESPDEEIRESVSLALEILQELVSGA